MLYSEFIDRYLLSIKWKVAKNQDDLITPDHVRYVCKIRSPIISGKLKTEFQQHADHSVQLDRVLQCLQCDTSAVHPDYGYPDLAEFVKYWGFDGSDGQTLDAALTCHAGCMRSLSLCADYFGEAGLADLMECEED